MEDNPKMAKLQKDPREVAIILLRATAQPDKQIYTDMSEPKYTTVDYYRMACHLLFHCQQCGTCCTTGDPIRLRQEDMAMLAKHLKIPLNKALKKYTIPDPDKPGVLDFKHIKPCKFFDPSSKGCKIYRARPRSCRIFPFLGIYGSEDKVKVNESCPGSVETMKVLTLSLEEVRRDYRTTSIVDFDEVKRAKEMLRDALKLI
jgi:Fe-S-cluster containining protein